MSEERTPGALGSNDGLGQLPEPEELDADYNDAGRVVAYGYTASTVRRLLAAERERWREHVAAVLDGIDRTEFDSAGWWPTSAGATFGADTLRRALEGPNDRGNAGLAR